ncbi:hypothetical protein FACS18949_01970 [Clostridia bacterium]|nr:hypothetical protein FACS18949_01970 [Clostridia bacterium]
MVKLKPHRFMNGAPVLYDREIDEYAHRVLMDYNPELLREPGTIDFTHFLETYVGARLMYEDIYYEDGDTPTLALSTFESGNVRVFDEDDESVRRVFVRSRSVVLDNALTKPGKESLALFTGLHEAGHLLIHWNAMTGEDYDEDGGADEIEDDEYESDAIVCCRRENIESFGSGKPQRAPEDWLEHHADYFAAAIAMPNNTFIPFVKRIMRENGYFKGAITVGADDDLDILADDIIPDAIREVFGVSKRAARIKLRKTQLVLRRL